MSDETVCGTAPATPGLLKSLLWQPYILLLDNPGESVQTVLLQPQTVSTWLSNNPILATWAKLSTMTKIEEEERGHGKIKQLIFKT